MEDILKPNEEPKPLVEQIKELRDKIDDKEKTKTKKFRLPWRARVGKKKTKKNWVGIIKLNENKTITPLRAKIDEGIIEDKEGIPYLGLSEYVYYWKNKPVIFVHAGTFEPISHRKIIDEASQRNTLNQGIKLLKNYMEKNQLEQNKKKFSGGVIVILLILAAVGYFIYKSGAFGG